MPVPPRTKSVLITGASSGIGAAIAEAYAQPGSSLVLAGRNVDRLGAVARKCEGRGAAVNQWVIDVRDLEPYLSELASHDDRHAFHTAIFNAGIGNIRSDGDVLERPRTSAALADVNFRAPAAGASLLAGRMAQRGCGAIGLVSSVAAYAPLAAAPGYAGSKAGLNVFARSLREALRPHGVSVTLICPAFVDTPMSRRLMCWKPFTVSAERAAQVIIHAIERRRRLIVFPLPYAIAVRFLTVLPDALVGFFLSRTNVRTLPYDPDAPPPADSDHSRG